MALLEGDTNEENKGESQAPDEKAAPSSSIPLAIEEESAVPASYTITMDYDDDDRVEKPRRYLTDFRFQHPASSPSSASSSTPAYSSLDEMRQSPLKGEGVVLDPKHGNPRKIQFVALEWGIQYDSDDDESDDEEKAKKEGDIDNENSTHKDKTDLKHDEEQKDLKEKDNHGESPKEKEKEHTEQQPQLPQQKSKPQQPNGISQQQPRLWVKSQHAWYSLQDPSDAYQPLYSTILLKASLCASLVEILDKENPPDYTTTCTLVLSKNEKFTEGFILTHSDFILDQLKSVGLTGKLDFVQELRAQAKKRKQAYWPIFNTKGTSTTNGTPGQKRKAESKAESVKKAKLEDGDVHTTKKKDKDATSDDKEKKKKKKKKKKEGEEEKETKKRKTETSEDGEKKEKKKKAKAEDSENGEAKEKKKKKKEKEDSDQEDKDKKKEKKKEKKDKEGDEEKKKKKKKKDGNDEGKEKKEKKKLTDKEKEEKEKARKAKDAERKRKLRLKQKEEKERQQENEKEEKQRAKRRV